MSKAFTRESDESGSDEVRSSRVRLPAGSRNYITRGGAEGLKQQLDDLLEKKRALARSPDAAAPASNADRIKLDSEIRKVQEILASVVVPETPPDREKIAFGAKVVIRRGNAEEETFQIVGVEEANPDCGCISWISPLARALLSKKAGEKVVFSSPAGSEELTILAVSY